MYLTRFRVNTRRRDARHLLASPHRLHGAVNAAFPTPPTADGAKPRVLWRLDRNPRDEILLFIVSPFRPDLTHLVDQAGWPAATDAPGWQTYGYDDFLTALEPGTTWGFRLTANPVHSIRRKDGEPTKRTAHLTPRHQARWLLDRQDKHGFEILAKPEEQRLLPEGDEHQLIVRDHRPLQFTKPGQDRRPGVSITQVTYDGRLRITDPALLRRTLTNGLGKAKAYGCGLMTLAPVR
ncbi:type I-E CRISPR-associated protein Cas6/Cse3/CasE [Streptomyces sp. PT12]|uniref:type I-E CRISPR-associated protein Cas6/Cse3/CasE n=1 Tax=Streptomyces sp. PT12 TaxID=1510197 RepID=UPI000DE5177A|nr:type I-E CRISPR-associated protein Cas6/Cse3/CasE [Streptomyces sp. PT12]RBM06838.1 type I-E CRISPR-associated protein Cas6/Cse3/CasE [Streptomyces sp. PT12]